MRAPSVDRDADFDHDHELHDWMEPGRGRGRGDDARDLIGRPARRSRLPMILLTILFLGILGAMGALGWSQRDAIAEFAADMGLSLSGVSEQAGSPAESPGSQTAIKDADRLIDDGRAPAATTPPAGPQATAVTPPDTDGVQADASLVAQRAVLLEEPLGGSNAVDSHPANVLWRYTESETNGPTIQASIEVPDRSMKVRLIFRKNVDASLPASHLIEIFVDTPSNFAGGSVRSVLDLLPKETEEAQGKKLTAATAKVAEGFFWIALSDEGPAVNSNIALLREGAWFDMPLVYANGQRAILTFEKGEPGRQAVAQALAAWGN